MNNIENDDMLTDSMLDHKRFYGNYSLCNEFFSSMEDSIIEQLVVEERIHKEWGGIVLNLLALVIGDRKLKINAIPQKPLPENHISD